MPGRPRLRNSSIQKERVASMDMRDEKPHIDAMLRHLGCFRDLRDFPGASTEKLALLRTAAARELIIWRKARARYELTHFGWNELLPRRRFGVTSLIVSAATGGIAGVVAAVFWLPADASRPRHPSASIARVEKPNVLRTAGSAEICVPRYAPLPTVNAGWNPAAAAPEPDMNEPPQPDRRDATGGSAADQPKARPGASGAKEAGSKKSRRTAHHRRADHGRRWAYGDPWRARSIRYAGYGGYGGQRGWFGYR